MQAKYVSAGNTISYTPTTALSAGAVVLLNELIAIATYPVEANQPCALAVQGVFEIDKLNVAMPLGAVAYWDNTAQKITLTDTGLKVGKVVRAAAASDAKVRVLLTP